MTKIVYPKGSDAAQRVLRGTVTYFEIKSATILKLQGIGVITKEHQIEKDESWFTFKVSPWAFEVLKEQPGLRPAPYLASRGLSWIQHYAEPGLSDKQLKDYVRQSYELVLKGVTKKKRIEQGLL